MIIDEQTNKLFLADALPKKYPEFFQRLEKLLTECKIDFQFLQNTRDVWAVDFMPIQISKDKFVQFTYNPDYLQSKKWLKSISDVDSICTQLRISPVKSTIVLDGGNVIRTKDKVVMCDKVFNENKELNESGVIRQLRKLFEVDKIFFVPWDKNDITGHADGMVRFVNDDTVLINDYSKEKPEYQRSFRMALHNAGLKWIEMPYNPYSNKSKMSARGAYINFLQMEGVVIVPTFDMDEDFFVIKIFENIFADQVVKTIECSDIANEGGVLNCISWNIAV